MHHRARCNSPRITRRSISAKGELLAFGISPQGAELPSDASGTPGEISQPALVVTVEPIGRHGTDRTGHVTPCGQEPIEFRKRHHPGPENRTTPLITINHDATVLTAIVGGGGAHFWDFFKRIALLATDFKTLRAIALGELVTIDGQMTVLTAQSLGLLRQQQQMMMRACIASWLSMDLSSWRGRRASTHSPTV
jgi:hypothetical protein